MPRDGDSVLQVTHHADVALRAMGQPNSIARQFDFWDDRYEGRRLFSEALGTFMLVLVAVGGGMVNARFGSQAVPHATALLWALIGKHGSAGLTLPSQSISAITAMWWEVIPTTGLASVIQGTAAAARQVGPLSAIVVGSYIALAGLWVQRSAVPR